MPWESVIFQYDGTFDGFLCCVFESYVYKEFPTAFYSDEECCPISFYSVRSIITQYDHARRVLSGLRRHSPEVVRVLRRAFLTCMENKEACLYAFVHKIFKCGTDFMKNQSDEVYYPLVKAIRHLNGELEKLRGFIRFSDYNGTLGAEIEPKNCVLPLLRHHFCARYANESFFIYDRTHKELLLHSRGRSCIVKTDSLQLTLPDEEELHYRTLWKRFYETVAIKERYNPRCQTTHMPKRYRGTMTEFLPVDYENQQRQTATPTESPADALLPDAPGARSVPVIPAECAPSAPVSNP